MTSSEIITLVLAILVVVLSLVTCVLVVLLLKRTGIQRPVRIENQLTDLAKQLREESEANRQVLDNGAQQNREELSRRMDALRDSVAVQNSSMTFSQNAQWETMRKNFEEMSARQDTKLEAMRVAVDEKLRTSLTDSINSFSTSQSAQWETMRHSIEEMSARNDTRLEGIRASVDDKLLKLQQGNEKKLDEMRGVVDEKLNRTLEERLGSSFKLVSDQLEQVYKNLGEMRSLSRDMGDIKNIFSNVKTRGTWGEVQLSSLLEVMLTPEQYAASVKLNPRSDEMVDFAIRLPGSSDDGWIWLPMDSKFPIEDYYRMIDAQDADDSEGYAAASKALENRILQQARSIRDKYIVPPYTTDFAILFVPLESLFAEIIRRPGLSERLQQEYRITIAGPTTLSALLSSLRMGFKTLAIQKRSSEVWKLLGAVKKQFSTFAASLESVEKYLERASKSVQDASNRTNMIQKKLDRVEELPEVEAERLLPTRSTDEFFGE